MKLDVDDWGNHNSAPALEPDEAQARAQAEITRLKQELAELKVLYSEQTTALITADRANERLRKELKETQSVSLNNDLTPNDRLVLYDALGEQIRTLREDIAEYGPYHFTARLRMAVALAERLNSQWYDGNLPWDEQTNLKTEKVWICTECFHISREAVKRYVGRPAQGEKRKFEMYCEECERVRESNEESNIAVQVPAVYCDECGNWFLVGNAHLAANNTLRWHTASRCRNLVSVSTVSE